MEKRPFMCLTQHVPPTRGNGNILKEFKRESQYGIRSFVIGQACHSTYELRTLLTLAKPREYGCSSRVSGDEGET